MVFILAILLDLPIRLNQICELLSEFLKMLLFICDRTVKFFRKNKPDIIHRKLIIGHLDSRDNGQHGLSQRCEVLVAHTSNQFNLFNQYLAPGVLQAIIGHWQQKLDFARTLHYLLVHKHVDQVDKLAASIV